MEWVVAVVVVAVLGVAAVVAAGGMGEMAQTPVVDVFAQDLPSERALRAADLHDLRFAVTLRGYSMRQVDALLDRLTRELADREATLESFTSTTGTGPNRGGPPTAEGERE